LRAIEKFPPAQPEEKIEICALRAIDWIDNKVKSHCENSYSHFLINRIFGKWRDSDGKF